MSDSYKQGLASFAPTAKIELYAWFLFVNFAELLTSNREKIITTCGKYGVGNVRVFGSVARGEADEKSDIDLLVSLSGNFGLFQLVALEEELSNIVGRKVDIVSDRIQRPTLRERILKDARPL